MCVCILVSSSTVMSYATICTCVPSLPVYRPFLVLSHTHTYVGTQEYTQSCFISAGASALMCAMQSSACPYTVIHSWACVVETCWAHLGLCAPFATLVSCVHAVPGVSPVQTRGSATTVCCRVQGGAFVDTCWTSVCSLGLG